MDENLDVVRVPTMLDSPWDVLNWTEVIPQIADFVSDIECDQELVGCTELDFHSYRHAPFTVPYPLVRVLAKPQYIKYNAFYFSNRLRMRSGWKPTLFELTEATKIYTSDNANDNRQFSPLMFGKL